MKVKAYLVIGCPGSGKSWVCDQLKDEYEYVEHDKFMGSKGTAYIKEIKEKAKKAHKPLLIETPFSISQIKDPLEKADIEVVPVFIQELPLKIRTRYWQRENKEIPQGHLTRQDTYKKRAEEWGAFQGTSQEVLDYLKGKAR